MKFVRRELSVREDRLFHSIRASFAGIIPCKKKKVPLSETDDGIFYHTNHRFFIEQYRNIGRRKMNNSVFFVLSLYNSKQAAITGRSDNLCPAVPLVYLRTNLSLDKYDKKHIAGLLGAIIGLDRAYRAKEAGFRTHFLVCLGSALFMLVSQYGFSDVIQEGVTRFDPGRVAAQVVSGIGFIGAGTIIIHRQFVRGLTTAAGLWATSGIGLAIGGGLYWLGIAATAFTLLGLELLTIIFKKTGIHSCCIKFSTGHYENIQKIMEMIRLQEGRITSYDAEERSIGDQKRYFVSIILRYNSPKEEFDIYQYIQQLPDLFIEKIE